MSIDTEPRPTMVPESDYNSPEWRRRLVAATFVADLLSNTSPDGDDRAEKLQNELAHCQQDAEHARVVLEHFTQLEDDMSRYEQELKDVAELQPTDDGNDNSAAAISPTYLGAQFGIDPQTYKDLREAFLDPFRK